MLTNVHSRPRFLTAISDKPAHGITLSPVKSRSCLAPGLCRFPLRPISTYPQPVVTAVKPRDCFTHPQEPTLRPTHCMIRLTASICRKGPPIGRYTGNREKIKAGFPQLCYLVATDTRYRRIVTPMCNARSYFISDSDPVNMARERKSVLATGDQAPAHTVANAAIHTARRGVTWRDPKASQRSAAPQAVWLSAVHRKSVRSWQ